MQLSELQRHLKDYIIGLPTNGTALTAAIAPPPADTIEDRLAIYKDGYEGRIIDIAEKTFPVLKKYLNNEAEFSHWCCEYIYAYPSTSFSASTLACHFSEFLKNKGLLFAAEMAALEWAIAAAVDTLHAKPLTYADLQAVPQEKWGDIILSCHPSLQIVSFDYNTLEIYEAVSKDNSIPEMQALPSACRVWRKDIQVYYLPIQPPEKLFLDSIQQKQAFGDICEKLAETMTEEAAAHYAVTQILTWLKDELITGIRISYELA